MTARLRSESPEIEPYFIAIGEMTTAWATLHEILGALFSVLMLGNTPAPGDSIDWTPTYVWHTIKSDRTQRDMLDAAFKHSAVLNAHKLKNELTTLGTWLFEACRKLEDRRNDAVHSSLILTTHEKGIKEVVPNLFMKNPRAEKLSKLEDLLAELHCTRDNIIKLFFFAQQLHSALINPAAPLPDKPELPGRRPKNRQASAPSRS